MNQEELKQRLLWLMAEGVLKSYKGFYSLTEIADHLIASGVTIREWIPVTERLPEDGGMYLVFNPKRAVAKVATVRYSSQSIRWCGVEALSYIEGITHWMPLPEPPETEKGYEGK